METEFDNIDQNDGGMILFKVTVYFDKSYLIR